MKKLLLIITSILFSLSLNANDDNRRREILSVLNEELSEVKRLSEQVGNRNPNVLLRIAELNLEQARIIREVENQKYLRVPIKKRRRLNKDKFFKKSRLYFKRAQSTGQYILKNFRTFKGRGDVYYILAFNAKEFSEHKKARRYLQLSVKFSKRSSPVNIKARLALAEIYYNEKNYKKAIPLYEFGLRKTKRDRWWTKDSYNLAWCYFRVGKKKSAINKMKEIYVASRSTKYIDMRNNIERDLAYFYAESGRVNSAIKFYKKNGQNIAINLMRVGRNLLNQGKYTSSEKVLSEALRHELSDKERIEINIMLLNLYERFGKIESHLKSSKRLQRFYEAGQLNKTQIANLKYHVKKMSAVLQGQVTGKAYKHQKKVRSKKTKLAVEYFSILSLFNKDKGYKDIFLAAETHYANGNYTDAISLYDTVITKAQASKDIKFERKALEGLMACLGQKSVPENVKERYLEKGYRLSIRKSPRSKKSFKIYQRLFNLYLSKKDITNAEKTLLSFKHNYPRSEITQEAMLAKVMDYYKDNKDPVGIKKWARKIENGEFRVSRKYAKKVNLLLLTMQFENVEKASSEGDKKKALRGYVKIYRSPETSKEAKKNASYNIAILFHELGDVKRTYDWTMRSLSHMGARDVKRFQAEYLSIVTEIFGRQKFILSLNIYQTILSKLCNIKSRNKKIFFKNAAIIAISERKFSKAESLIAKARSCGVNKNYIVDAQFDLLMAYRDAGRLSQYEKMINDLAQNKVHWPRLIVPLGYLARDYSISGRISDLITTNKRVIKYYNYASEKGVDLDLDALDFVAKKKISDLKSEIKKLKKIKLEFPEKVFNARLKNKFKRLDAITTKSLALLAIGSGKGIVQAYYYLSKVYIDFSLEIEGFKPKGKSAQYLSSFQKSMKEVASPLKLKATEFRNEAIKEIQSSKILSKYNSWFLGSSDLKFPIEFHLSRQGVLMDRGGAK